MKNLLIIMMFMSTMTYGEVKFAPELEGTKWEASDKKERIIFEFEAPYLTTKTYENSKYTGTKSHAISSYKNTDDLHFLFLENNNDDEALLFRLQSDGSLKLTSIDTYLEDIYTLNLTPYK